MVTFEGGIKKLLNQLSVQNSYSQSSLLSLKVSWDFCSCLFASLFFLTFLTFSSHFSPIPPKDSKLLCSIAEKKPINNRGGIPPSIPFCLNPSESQWCW